MTVDGDVMAGFTPQKEIVYNGLLPYSERLDREATELLAEIKANLEGTAIDSLEVLKVKEDRLVQVNQNLKESASLVELLIVEDPERMNELMESEDAKSLQAASTIRACEERLARF